MRVRIASNVGDRRPPNIYGRWFEELLEGGQSHVASVVGMQSKIRNEGAMTGPGRHCTALRAR